MTAMENKFNQSLELLLESLADTRDNANLLKDMVFGRPSEKSCYGEKKAAMAGLPVGILKTQETGNAGVAQGVPDDYGAPGRASLLFQGKYISYGSFFKYSFSPACRK